MKDGPWIKSFQHAFFGIWDSLSTQRNMQIHFGAAAVVLALALWMQLSTSEILVLFFAITLVILTEMINTAIEQTVDLVTQDFHPLAKKAKDIAAGAVLVASINAVMVGLIVLARISPRLLAMLSAVILTFSLVICILLNKGLRR